MAEEHGKGVALVILGIVAIIAIVGLVLLFTGARKTATGDFVAPSVKSYGGAILNEEMPYARAGRAVDFQSRDFGSAGVQQGGQCYGDTCKEEAIFASEHTTYNRAAPQIPAKATCSFIAEQSGLPQLSEPASAQEAANYGNMGRQCVAVVDLASVADKVSDDTYGRRADAVEYAQSLGVSHCCEAPSLQVR